MEEEKFQDDPQYMACLIPSSKNVIRNAAG